MRFLLLSFLAVVVSVQSAYAEDSSPNSNKTLWRIPPNAAVVAVGSDLQWSMTEEPSGRVSLQAGLAEHHTYEQAWSYYTQMFGFETTYNAKNKRQQRVVDGDKRSMLEHDRDQVFRAGRWARMYGKFGRYRTSLSLYSDPGLTKTHRVYVNILFTPE